MDVVTHTLTGYLLGRAGLNHFCPRASAILVLAANAPDLDLVSMAGGAELALEHHRGITHSLIGLPLLAMLPTLVVAPFVRGRMRWLHAWLLGAIGIASHLLLDLANVRGVQLVAPLSERWFHLDVLPSTDFAIVAILLAATAWLALSRLVSGEIGSVSYAGRGVALLALATVVIWTGARWTLHQRAVSLLDSHLYQSELPVRVAAFPHFLNPLRWRGLADTGSAYHLFDMNLRERRFDPDLGDVLYRSAESANIQAAQSARPVRTLLDSARFPYWTLTPAEEPAGARRVELVDLALSRPGEERFTATAIIDERGSVVESWTRY